jgi:hypothetical protein
MSLRSGDVRAGKLIHETAPPGEGNTIDTLARGYFIVTPAGSLAWFGRGGPLNADGEHTGPEGVWDFDAEGEHLLGAGEWIARPLRWSAGTLSTGPSKARRREPLRCTSSALRAMARPGLEPGTPRFSGE